MFLKAWNMSDGTVHIHEARCGHRRPQKTGRPPWQQEQVEFGKVDWTSKEAFCFDYWNNGILEEYEREHGELSFDIWQGMEWKPCTDDLQDNEPVEAEPEPEPRRGKAGGKARAKTPRQTGHRSYLTKPVPQAMLDYTAWLEREYADLYPNGLDPRLVMVSLRGYSYFQRSDLSYKGRSGKHGEAA